jgi:hypothetical protein
MPSVVDGGERHPSHAEVPASSNADGADVDMSEAAAGADASNDEAAAGNVNAVGVTNTKAGDETDDDDDDDDADANYQTSIRQQAIEEEKIIDDTIAAEVAAIPEDDVGEMVGTTHATDEQLKQMRSMYVKDADGILHHKRALLKRINNGKGLGKKSHDREKRARGDARHGNGTRLNSADSCVKRAYRFAHDIDSGSNYHAPGDFCCVLVEATSSKVAHMLIAKFVRFGNINNNVPLELSWPIETTSFKASIEVIGVETYSNIDDEVCLRSTGSIVATFRSVQSDCITAITPSLEEAEVDGNSMTNAVMKLSELKTVFEDMKSNVTRYYKLPKKTSLQPIEVDGDTPFVVTNKVSELPVCSICQPAMTIGKRNCEKQELQRYIRNHAASHFWASSLQGEPCGLCCKDGCSARLSVKITKGEVKKVLLDNAHIPPRSLVFHGCQTFKEVEPFEFKWCNKAISGFPCLNMPVICHACTTDHSLPTFLWSYNIENHYIKEHGSFGEEERQKYSRYINNGAEREQVRKYFRININNNNI